MDSLIIGGSDCYNILVVDDVAEVRQLLRTILERMGHTVMTANSAPQALQILNSFFADVIISDISMAAIDGYELARQLRRRPDTRLCFLVAMTGNGADSSEQASLAAGFDAHLDKPFSLDAIRTILTAPKSRRANDAVY